jgi:Transposase IS66 family
MKWCAPGVLSTRPSTMVPTSKRWRCICTRDNCSPRARINKALAAICGCQIWEGTLIQWRDLAAELLAATVERIADLVAASRLQHGDETGIRVYGMLHVNCTRFLHDACHEWRLLHPLFP